MIRKPTNSQDMSSDVYTDWCLPNERDVTKSFREACICPGSSSHSGSVREQRVVD